MTNKTNIKDTIQNVLSKSSHYFNLDSSVDLTNAKTISKSIMADFDLNAQIEAELNNTNSFSSKLTRMRENNTNETSNQYSMNIKHKR